MCGGPLVLNLDLVNPDFMVSFHPTNQLFHMGDLNDERDRRGFLVSLQPLYLLAKREDE